MHSSCSWPRSENWSPTSLLLALANFSSLFTWVAVETVAEPTSPHKRLTLALRCSDVLVAGHCKCPRSPRSTVTSLVLSCRSSSSSATVSGLTFWRHSFWCSSHPPSMESNLHPQNSKWAPAFASDQCLKLKLSWRACLAIATLHRIQVRRRWGHECRSLKPVDHHEKDK